MTTAWAITYGRRELEPATRAMSDFRAACRLAALFFRDQREFPGKPHLHKVRLPPVKPVYREIARV